MTAKLEQLNEILGAVRELEEKIKAIDVLPNWELGLKNDLLRHISSLDYGVSDFILSAVQKINNENKKANDIPRKRRFNEHTHPHMQGTESE